MTKSNDVNKKENIIDCKPIKKQKNKKIENESNFTNKPIELSKDNFQPNITILENNLKDINIRYVVHMADIHIHKREREKEKKNIYKYLIIYMQIYYKKILIIKIICYAFQYFCSWVKIDFHI